ncbi:MAG: hypothetical protein COA79_16745 [Planctomycetota bacterium]|nr:MAG: hypothetical protein COA79_16745 [Planctomycetota bacterium]
MEKPDFNRSIVNLMSSILGSFEVKSQYQPLESLPVSKLRKYKNVILLVIDGMGYNFLENEVPNSLLNENKIDKLTSVFPTTTASAITTFMTGDAPQQHAITGWNMWLKELGMLTTILPFRARCGERLNNAAMFSANVFKSQSVFSKIKSQSFYLIPKSLSGSVYSNWHSKGSLLKPVKNAGELFNTIYKCTQINNRKKYIYSYWPNYDHLAHQHGYNSSSAVQHFGQLESHLKLLCKQLEKTSSLLLVTADHGFVNTSKDKVIFIEDHPILSDCLMIPLCGEARLAYCYVKPNCEKEFLEYIKNELKEVCEVSSSLEVLENNYFGLGEIEPALLDRIGTYILFMKDNYVIKDRLVGETHEFHPGRHGGCSENEMYVPLISFEFDGEKI